MENKTIIDGIDVSKCIDFIYPIGCNSKNTKSIECKKNPNCYFKQLARAKDKIDYMEEYIKTVENARNELKQECDQLKQTLTEIKEIAEKHKVTAHCDYLIDMDKILQKISEVKQ